MQRIAARYPYYGSDNVYYTKDKKTGKMTSIANRSKSGRCSSKTKREKSSASSAASIMGASS
ncbi:Multimodular transpeptidase-transglycosylase [Geobacillus stearothermophilus]|uniref:Multimodular transpeptidase-transglycosylase n=1 Tax=Geobacillus stearothermophilus TaxID=1422 RepID=A0A0K9HLF6_GEOSE|nr:Multimodular transpeptidase-transglycosylase [Geobacillus stearothermophilus]KOR92527.1 hypothetical protein N231_12775 [Geobacillus stearothermophilus ATCC 12980]KMY59701.1 hypothetical protein AA904_10155 [Geobacillus stearothermophilus]KMY61727.1 hypothetical protein AA906_03145 [Geobacillus stearothermophilus]KMY62574.1 hypothetical protein AA905_06785 [Geobacillus stearothermophilus]